MGVHPLRVTPLHDRPLDPAREAVAEQDSVRELAVLLRETVQEMAELADRVRYLEMRNAELRAERTGMLVEMAQIRAQLAARPAPADESGA